MPKLYFKNKRSSILIKGEQKFFQKPEVLIYIVQFSFRVFEVKRMNEMIKLRTMETAYQAIKEMDPDTAITRWAIRQAVTGGYVPSRRVGNKYVINLDSLLDYFNVKAS